MESRPPPAILHEATHQLLFSECLIGRHAARDWEDDKRGHLPFFFIGRFFLTGVFFGALPYLPYPIPFGIYRPLFFGLALLTLPPYCRSHFAASSGCLACKNRLCFADLYGNPVTSSRFREPCLERMRFFPKEATTVKGELNILR